MSIQLPHASDAQVLRAVMHVGNVLNAASQGNQHNENMVVLMDQATAMYQRIAVLEDLLERCAEFIDGYVDVVDGDYGQPEPNKAMRLMAEIREEVPASPTNT